MMPGKHNSNRTEPTPRVASLSLARQSRRAGHYF